MEQELLLDTNAFFNLLKMMNPDAGEDSIVATCIDNLKSKKLVVSTITEVEIISVMGKYARGSHGGTSKCNCLISDKGDVCQNTRYTVARKKWNKNRVKAWMQLISEIFEGKSKLLTINVEPFNTATIEEAKKVIIHALLHSFASMDAMIDATAKLARENGRDVTVVTSDKGLKACLRAIGVPCDDYFSKNREQQSQTNS